MVFNHKGMKRYGRRVHASHYTGRKKKKAKPLIDLDIDKMMHKPVKNKTKAGIIKHYYSIEGD